MDIQDIRTICSGFPHVEEDIKWGNDLAFMIGKKMFCVVGLDESPTTATFKVTDDQFEEISTREHFKPAPYLARHKWVMIDDIDLMRLEDWKYHLKQSYDLVRDKLPAKTKLSLTDVNLNQL